MQYSISPDTYHRTLTDGEVGLMRSMGWNMVPEPATATLSLLGLPHSLCAAAVADDALSQI